MHQDTYRTIQYVLSSNDPDDLQHGLALVKAEAPGASAHECNQLLEMVLPLFYIDPLDHPEHAPVIESAIIVLAGMGEAIIPALIDRLEDGDVKAQMAMAQTLGRMGAQAIDPLIAQYQSGCANPACRAFLLYALGKVKSAEIIRAAALAVEASGSPEVELRDTAMRAIGKFVESIPPGGLPGEVKSAFLAHLKGGLADPSSGVRAKAARSLGKLAKYGHLSAAERAELKVRLQRQLGEDESFAWDRAYIVRKEAKEALGYL